MGLTIVAGFRPSTLGRSSMATQTLDTAKRYPTLGAPFPRHK